MCSSDLDDLLDMSAILSGKVRLEIAELDLCALAGEAIDAARPGAEGKGIDIALAPCSDAPALPYLGDAARLRQVLTNLIGNAIKFTPDAGKVTVTLDASATHLRISVSDSGIGIDPLFLPHVFDRFRQADASSTRSAGGLGLGLAIAKQLVDMHHGQLSVSSDGVGLGATFTLLLPRNDVHALDPVRRSDGAALAATLQRGAASLRRIRVLVVDDDMDSRGVTQRFLQEAGAVVETAVSADDAEALLRERPYDLLVSDVGMPRRDGHSLIRSVRSRGAGATSRIPAIALTAYVRGEDRSLALDAGFNAHLGKPVDPVKLVALAASLVQPQTATEQDPNAQAEPA